MLMPHDEPPATGILPFEPPLLAPDGPAAYRRFWQLWREERFWECHEALEELWRDTTGARRWFYNGLIHCAVAVYQHRRGNAVGAARQLARAEEKLARFRPAYEDVNVDALLEGVARAVQESVARLSIGQREDIEQLRERIRKNHQTPGVPGD